MELVDGQVKLSALDETYFDNYDETYNNIMEYLLSIEKRIKEAGSFLECKKHIANYKEAKELVKRFYSEYFKLYPVYHCWDSAPLPIVKGVIKSGIGVDPFNLPIRVNRQTLNDMRVHFSQVAIDSSDFETAKEIYLVSSYIEGSRKRNNTIIAPIFAHEIAHTQVFAPYLTVKNKNSECVSIFVEKLCAEFLGVPMLEATSSYRLSALIDELDALECFDSVNDTLYYKNELLTYINSTIKATMLWEKYRSSDSSGKASIIDSVQAVFDGTITVEEMLEKNGIKKEDHRSLELVKSTFK